MDDDANVLTMCPLPSCVNIDILREEVRKYMLPRISFYERTNRSLYIEDEFSEYFTSLATGGCEIGRGNIGMDVKTSTGDGIDAMCVIMNHGVSNEKSIIQNFKSSGCNLDMLFETKNDHEAVALFMADYKRKLEKVTHEKKLKRLYILAYISTDKEVYLACLMISPSNIENVCSGGFVKSGCVNIVINRFMDDVFGKVTLYKSKKRVELRFKKEILQHPHIVKLFEL